MKKRLKPARIILALVLLMPALFFSAYEISTLNSYESQIQEIYARQLDAILYSVNQYSVDVVGSLASKAEAVLSSYAKESPGFEAELKKIFSGAPSVKSMFVIEDKGGLKLFRENNGGSKILPELADIDSILVHNRNIIDRLYRYKRGGYRKVEVLENIKAGGLKILVFLSEDKNSKEILCGFSIDPLVFIRQTLSPRIQEITQQKFIISIVEAGTRNVVYQSENTTVREFRQMESLWLLSGYSMNIALKGVTIQQVVEERSRLNVILIVLINAVLIIGFFFVFRNIRKEMELAQLKSDFVSNVSHELRTPLALINMYAETLEMGRVSSEEKKNQYYTVISQEANRLSRIVNKILSFSKMEAGRLTYKFERLDLNSLIRQITSAYGFHMQSNGFEFNVETDAEIPLIMADRETVSEALINLIDNAMKYSLDEKNISIKTGLEKGYVFAEVSDKGVGIEPGNKDKIFEKFFRVSTGLVHDTKGTGLGLALVKQIMDGHKGKVTLTSIPGKGSSFRLYFRALAKDGNNPGD